MTVFKSTTKASIVLGASFGDEGKGTVVNSLCENSKNDIIIRFSGGQQAGHTVVKGGIRHVFSSYGSGTLKGVSTYISEHCTIDIEAMLNEYDVLTAKGVKVPTIMIHPLTKITTPWDVEANVCSSVDRQNGTCGMGIGKTMQRNETVFKLTAIDLHYPALFADKLYEIYKKYYSFFDDARITRIMKALKKLDFKIVNYDILNNYNHLIFEGSQGIMLDMDHGTIPNVTYANTTSKNAFEIINKLNNLFVQHGLNTEIYYVTRNYLTRHGNGWMPNEDEIVLKNNKNETNKLDKYQGEFRTGKLDYDLLSHAFAIDKLYSGNTSKNIVVTCLDQTEDVFDYNKLSLPLTINRIYTSSSEEGPKFT